MEMGSFCRFLFFAHDLLLKMEFDVALLLGAEVDSTLVCMRFCGGNTAGKHKPTRWVGYRGGGVKTVELHGVRYIDRRRSLSGRQGKLNPPDGLGTGVEGRKRSNFMGCAIYTEDDP